MNYSDTLNYIYSFANFHVSPTQPTAAENLSLARMEQLLDAIGNPHKKFRSIHITGTKGKGSTAATIESILRTAGYRTGFYTSPHLHTFRERIRVDGQVISADDVTATLEKLKPVIDALPDVITFEIITALAFDYFVVHGVDIAVLEVGLGGRLDATNVVTPLVSVITSISYDHMAILGNTLAQIAHEKAGIIKPNVPIVTAPQREEAFRVIEETAREKNAPMIAISDDLQFQVAGSHFQVVPVAHTLDSQTLEWKNQNEQPVACNLPLLGKHQLSNAATALATISVLRDQGIAISDDAVRNGISSVEWHGRFEILARHPFVVVDGAHNGDSAHQLVTTLHDYFPNARLHFIFGASNDKDIAGMFAELVPHATSFTLTRSNNARASDPTQLAVIASEQSERSNLQIEIHTTPNLALAMNDARARATSNDVICVTGSLFVVAEAREVWFTERGVMIEKD
jgi:dihydrofolate synthase/folylpolyglutamate synthase